MRLSLGPASVSVLFEPHAMALPTLLQHIRVLEISGLNGTKKSGRLGRSPRQHGRIRDQLTSKGEKHGKRLMTDDVIFMVPGKSLSEKGPFRLLLEE
jgi:hypothetical protein